MLSSKPDPSSQATETSNSPSNQVSTTKNSVRGGVAGATSSHQIPLASTTKEDTKEWSPSLQNLLDQPPATLPLRLLLGGIVFCMAFGAWAWFGTVEDVGHAQGKLVPKGKTFKVEPYDSGKVIEVAVKEGIAVEAGQVLVELDSDLSQQEIERLQKMLKAYQTELEQKQDLLERVSLEAKTRQAIAAAETLAQRSAIAMAEGKAGMSHQLLEQMRSETAAYRARQARLSPLSEIAQEQREQLRLDAEAQQQRLDRLKPLVQEGAISKEFIFQAEQDLRNAQQRLTQNKLQDLTDTKEQLFNADQSLRDIEARITQNQGDLSSSLKEAEQLQAQLTQKQAEERRIKLEAEQQIQQLKVEITQLQAQIADTQSLIQSAQSQLKQKFLKSPVDGTVLSLDIQNTGEVVQPGQTVAEIAPQGAPLVLSAVLPNQEAGFVKPGMPVKVKFDAYPYQDYGVVPGEVISLSADAKPDEQLGAVYRVDVALERNYITSKQKKIRFKPGQTATADIVIRRRRIVDVLFAPFKKLQKGGIDL